MTLNKRIAEQIEIKDREFLGRPRKLVTFENPVYEEDSVSQIFQQDVADAAEGVLAAPHEEFRDVVRLGRPQFSQAQGGRVRLSRIGKKATIKTRSGLQIGPKVHYYQDISSINPAEDIELTVLGEQSGDAAIATPLQEGVNETAFHTVSFDDSIAVLDLNEPVGLGSEDDLIDTFDTDVGENLQLLVNSQGRQQFQIPVPAVRLKGVVEVVPDFEPVVIFHPENTSHTLIPSIYPHDVPYIIINLDTSGPDFSLHPSLFKRKKKKLSL